MSRRPDLPIVVVGAGVAGLATALAAAPAPVLLLCRDPEGRGSASALAQGGIAAALAAGDSVAAHAHDTWLAGAGHGDRAQVDWLCRQGPASVAWLRAMGVDFDRDGAGQLQLGREGGHACARIVHAGGDATGAALVRALLARARAAGHIEWAGGYEAEALRLRSGRVCAVRARRDAAQAREIECRALVLATGGLGALFARSSNPEGADGSGLALAQAAGAALRDLEFVQFHPTALDVAGSRLPLLTEALRGAGARLYDAAGRALMAGQHPLGDLAPRDIVARRVWHACADGGAWLDARGIEDFTTRFPSVFAACRAHALDPRRQRLPVSPAAHFHMGGVAVDGDGQSTVPGLYAVGEVACSGVHGANRLASNSLLEAVACGRRLGARLSVQPVRGPALAAARWCARGRGLDARDRERLADWLWRTAGPLRDGEALRRARDACRELRACGWQARIGEALLDAAWRRPRSLGAHARREPAPHHPCRRSAPDQCSGMPASPCQ